MLESLSQNGEIRRFVNGTSRLFNLRTRPFKIVTALKSRDKKLSGWVLAYDQHGDYAYRQGIQQFFGLKNVFSEVAA